MNSLRIIYHKLLYILPKSLAHKIMYYTIKGKRLDLKNPKDINEKIHYMMVYRYGKKYGMLTDKCKVRNFVKDKGYEKLLPKLYGVYNNVNEIDIEKLPEKFVLKTNHGSGEVFICTNKKIFNFENCKKLLKKSLKKNYAYNYLEYHYKYIQPKIICEEFLSDQENRQPYDYKFFCFNGKADCILVCSDREQKNYRDFFDLNWNYLNYAKEEKRNPNKISKPKNLDKMIEYAEKLSNEFEFVRVDLYNINGKIYFGEMTFTPAAGYMDCCYDEVLQYLGSKMKIKEGKSIQ